MARPGVIYFAGQDDMLPTSASQVQPKPMCGYQLSAATFTDVRSTLALHGITSRTNADGRYVTLRRRPEG